MERMAASQPIELVDPDDIYRESGIGLTEREARQFSLVNAIRARLDPRYAQREEALNSNVPGRRQTERKGAARPVHAH